MEGIDKIEDFTARAYFKPGLEKVMTEQELLTLLETVIHDGVAINGKDFLLLLVGYALYRISGDKYAALEFMCDQGLDPNSV